MLEKKINSNTRISNKLIKNTLNLSNIDLSNKNYDDIRLVIKNNKNSLDDLLNQLKIVINQSGGGLIQPGIGIVLIFTIIMSLIYKIKNKEQHKMNTTIKTNSWETVTNTKVRTKKLSGRNIKYENYDAMV